MITPPCACPYCRALVHDDRPPVHEVKDRGFRPGPPPRPTAADDMRRARRFPIDGGRIVPPLVS